MNQKSAMGEYERPDGLISTESIITAVDNIFKQKMMVIFTFVYLYIHHIPYCIDIFLKLTVNFS